MEENLVIISTKEGKHYVHKLNEPKIIYDVPYDTLEEAINEAYKLLPIDGGKILPMGELKDIHFED